MPSLSNDAANLAIAKQTSSVLETIKVSRYVRGQLIDISSIAREAGLRIPTALTSAVWGQSVSDMSHSFSLADVREHEETIWQIARDVQNALRQAPGRICWRVLTLSSADREGHNWPLEVTARLEVGEYGETVLVISDPTDLFV